MNTVTFRKAEREDVALILEFIKGLAAYEKMENEVVADEALLEEWIFDKQKAEVIFAVADGKEVGFALFFHNFSTFLGRAGLYLEDLFVKPEYRGKGYGKAILKKLAAIAVERGCGRLEWSCLDWNKPSIDFYRSLGAVPMEEWTVYRSLTDVAAQYGIPVTTFAREITFGEIQLTLAARTYLSRSTHPITAARFAADETVVAYGSSSWNQGDEIAAQWFDTADVLIFGAHSPVYKKPFALAREDEPYAVVWNGKSAEYGEAIPAEHIVYDTREYVVRMR